MYTRAELKQNAKNVLKGKWGSAILASIIGGIVIGIISWGSSFISSMLAVVFEDFGALASIVLLVLQSSLIMSMTVGLNSYFLKIKEENKPEPAEIFNGFKFSFSNSAIMGCLIYVYTLLWSLLFIIPGIIKSFSYSMASYIMAENPTIEPKEAISQSMKLMNGHKAELFFLELSFLGWCILAVCTCGIGFIWLTPYMNKTLANFYEAIKNEATVVNEQ